MARQRVSVRTAARYRRETGLPVIGALVRGGTDHRVDLALEGDRRVWYWWPGSADPPAPDDEMPTYFAADLLEKMAAEMSAYEARRKA